jgi:hypothetical protein
LVAVAAALQLPALQRRHLQPQAQPLPQEQSQRTTQRRSRRVPARPSLHPRALEVDGLLHQHQQVLAGPR